MSGAQLGSIVLDAGALIEVERGGRRVLALVDEGLRAGSAIVVPAPVLAQVWRGGKRQALLARFRRLPQVVVVPFTATDLESTASIKRPRANSPNPTTSQDRVVPPQVRRALWWQRE